MLTYPSPLRPHWEYSQFCTASVQNWLLIHESPGPKIIVATVLAVLCPMFPRAPCQLRKYGRPLRSRIYWPTWELLLIYGALPALKEDNCTVLSNLTPPFTSKSCVGVIVPMPTLPLVATYNSLAPLELATLKGLRFPLPCTYRVLFIVALPMPTLPVVVKVAMLDVPETVSPAKLGDETTAIVEVPEMTIFDPWVSSEAMEENVGVPLGPAFKTWKAVSAAVDFKAYDL